MKKIFYNKNNLKEEDINRIEKRAKILIINSNDEILFAYSHNNYFFVGGHVEENESFDEAIVREIKEETGIDIPLQKRTPFINITYLNKDYPKKGVNSKFIANYYSIKCDTKPDLDKTTLTEEEKDGKFELRYIHKDKALKILYDSLKNCTWDAVVKDTIEVVKEYFNIT